MKRELIFVVAMALAGVTSSSGQYVYMTNLFPVADASNREAVPNSNDGGSNAVMAGVSNDGLSRSRGLFRFDVSGIPTNATVTNVSVSLIGLSQPMAVALFGLNPMLTNWAEAGVTWNDRAASMPWTAVGGQAGADFAAEPSAVNLLLGSGATNQFTNFMNYPFYGLVYDVQTWVSHPEQNFGWMLLPNDESSAGSVIQVGSRENPGNQPVLTVAYTKPLTLPTITAPMLTNGEFLFHVQHRA